MRKLILFMSTSLDGRIGGANDETTAENTIDTPEQEDHRYANQLFAAADTVVFGRLTYEGFIGYWDTLDLSDASVPAVEVEFAQAFRRLNRVVFSRTLTQVPDNTLLINDDIPTQVGKLKKQVGQDILLVCGPELLATLAEQGLVDELLLIILPKALGKGQSLFGQLRQPMNLTLMTTRAFKSGGVLHQYQINNA
ncbi:dihydrofolate reductase [Spirosoma sp. BT702]|uniref:Dihydrofolate reductase n=1 Tax=Spirosoma profusum TaxID=2771354 RepID=A0A927GAR2_9BACT|nr:dihydrofolate reductase family protein [Spirosoma profusum]MBD2705757.1 dihydrofolate reductase [Spirosoma profusum]